MRFRTPVVIFSAIGTVIGSSVIYKEYKTVNYKGDERLEGKVVIVTGANTGLGKQVATNAASRGAKVIMACRDLEKCLYTRKQIVINTENNEVLCSKLDLASLKSIREFADRVKKKEPKIDILVNNAGVMRCPKSITEDAFETQLGVNHLGPFLLTNLLLDQLRNAKNGARIINVSSVAHTRGTINFEDINSEKNYDKAKAYNQSKLANVLFTRELAKRLKNENIYVYSLHPGIVYTEIGRHMGYFDSFLSKIFVKPFLWLFTKSPKQGIQTILYCMLSKDIENHNSSGKYFVDCKEKEPSKEALDDVTALKLWLLSEKWTRLK